MDSQHANANYIATNKNDKGEVLQDQKHSSLPQQK